MNASDSNLEPEESRISAKSAEATRRLTNILPILWVTFAAVIIAIDGADRMGWIDREGIRNEVRNILDFSGEQREEDDIDSGPDKTSKPEN